MGSSFPSEVKMESSLSVGCFCYETAVISGKLPEPPLVHADNFSYFDQFIDFPLINAFNYWWDDMDLMESLILPPGKVEYDFGPLNVDFTLWDEDFPSSKENALVGAASLSVSTHHFDGNESERGRSHFGETVPVPVPVAESSRLVDKPPEGKCRSHSLDFEEISKYFYVPITQAAKELKVGLTVLKKRCRDLGISRWPHRKMKSLNSLIHNVQELKRSSGALGEIRQRVEEIERLEEHMKLMEKRPELQLTEETKKLRQACFKANYKKRRLVAIAACP
ncbi:uncharacterized protein [Aristolochia californica]|uniref:uncharacterized protein n=1 Tax=Aristolochia californica TaxID=171875 RepID=UPI0035D64432